ncbi:hypothetical protein P618_200716 [Holospora obtusa F1]|uniref:Sugar fermentation stimulation protein homolog n=1 Tax=Holospora obtusa F1 TaxID=1399147 RepID=W6TDH2_HOLOB|nr:DNA/RNA nuclease SfsA [Holospora obtusa]ETZ07088.1 hypothetical protein P618_200716 [Holospora obtusa F1]
MKFWTPPQRGTLIRRYKRFFADIELENGEQVTAHCVNTGAMLGLTHPGSHVWVCSKKPESLGKLPFVWMMEEVQEAHITQTTLVGTNTSIPSILIKEALTEEKFPEWKHLKSFKAEPKIGSSRLDFLLTFSNDSFMWIEVKNVHLTHHHVALFPDCVTQRGTKHLHILTQLAQQGKRATMIYVVQRHDCSAFQIAGFIDSEYGSAFETAYKAGVTMLAYKCKMSFEEITLDCVPLSIGGVRWQTL